MDCFRSGPQSFCVHDYLSGSIALPVSEALAKHFPQLSVVMLVGMQKEAKPASSQLFLWQIENNGINRCLHSGLLHCSFAARIGTNWTAEHHTMEISTPSGPGSSGVAARLRDEIIAGMLKPNDRLPPQRDLSKKFNCSRGTVQRALRQLSQEGLVQTIKGSGTYVVGETSARARRYAEPTRPLELMDARFAFEPHICRLAVMNAIKADFAELEELLDAMDANAENSDRFAEFDDLFHFRLAETTGNSLLIWIAEQLKAVRAQQDWLRMRQITLDRQIIVRYNQQHRSILDAIRAREPEIAARCMRDHLETARLSLTRASAT